MALEDTSDFSKQITKRDKFGCEFCYVPAGPFLCGEAMHPEEILAPFYISKYPVTKAQFLVFLEQTGYDYSPIHLQLMNKIAPDPDCPATPISWWDAKYYVRWLRRVTGEYYSLPIELEWEIACRGTDGRQFPWGDRPATDLHACFTTTRTRDTSDIVGTHPLGNAPSGCCDMCGNVWEWCLDPVDEENDIHVLRGGSAQDNANTCSCTSRSFISPATMRVNFAGFRVIYLPGQMFDDYVAAQSQMM
jgi:formylglycine-generating enzyme required for sulfatase activity